MAKKFWSGEICPTKGIYGQYRDTNGAYAGTQHDRKVEKGSRFPPSQNNHHFCRK